jgi:hypothetical protein
MQQQPAPPSLPRSPSPLSPQQLAASIEPPYARPAPLSFPSLDSGDLASLQQALASESSGTVAPGFGSALQLASAEVSRRNSLAPAAAAAAAAEAAMAGAASSERSSLQSDGDAAESAPPGDAAKSAPAEPAPFVALTSVPGAVDAHLGSAGDTAAVAEASALETTSVEKSTTGEAGLGQPPVRPASPFAEDAAVQEEWPTEPATTFQTLSRPAFGSLQGALLACPLACTCVLLHRC